MRSAVEIADLLGLHHPTPEQTAIIESPLEPLLVVAGAGSGKTDTMAARVVYLLANDLVEPERVLGLTFTRKAAGELAERVRGRLRVLNARLGARGSRTSAFAGPSISTYNSYAAALVGDHAVRLGLEPSARLLGEAGRWQLAHDVVEHWAQDLDVDLAPSTVTAAVLDLAGGLAEHLVDPAELRAEAERLVEAIAGAPETEKLKAADRNLLAEVQRSLALRARLVDLVEAFTLRKRETDVVDFADQVALAARLAREVPDVGAGERARFGVVLLDEYQDTSVAQLGLLRHLFGGASGAGAGHPVTAVGDPHQSIYGWRGASAGGLERFGTDFPRNGPDGPEPAGYLALSTSWRNDRAVLVAANLLAEPLRAAAGAGAGAVSGAGGEAGSRGIVLPTLRPRADAGSGEVVSAYLATAADEARAVAEFVVERRRSLRAERDATLAEQRRSDPHRSDLHRDAPPVTAAVLCRKRSQFPVLEAALLEAGLPVEVVGLGGLLTTPEVIDLIAALEAAHDPSRGDSLMRLLTGPRARLGLADLHALSDWSAEQSSPVPHRRGAPTTPVAGDGPVQAPAPDVVDERSIVDALDALPRADWVSRHGRTLSGPGRARLVELAGLLRSLRSQTFLPVVDLVAEAERLLGLDIEVAVRSDVAPAVARSHLDAFRAVAASFDADDGGTLGAFLAWLDAAQREERGLEAPVAEMNPEAVQLLTVHAAKGLEWDVVAVPGLVDRTFPMSPRTTGWIKDNGALPTVLRGDRESLPDVALTPGAERAELARRLADYRHAYADHHLAEERRLAYVALTRARSSLMLCGSWWRDAVKPTSPSVFLHEVVEAGVATRATWTPDPSETDGIPVRPQAPAGDAPVWPPADAVGVHRQERLERAAEAVRRAMAQRAATSGDLAVGGDPREDLASVAALLLEERRRGRADRATVPLPQHLSASALVRLADDAEAFALQLRRPVPLAPSAVARRGTAFHAWVEQYYGSAALVDVDELPGADDASVRKDPELAALRERFLASPWAARVPVAVEVDVETPVGGTVLRCRIDAVFAEPGGDVVVVDWKTGKPPTDPADQRARALQLAVYRLAWARWTGTPVEKVRAAFFYVATGETVRPELLPDEADIAALTQPGQRG